MSACQVEDGWIEILSAMKYQRTIIPDKAYACMQRNSEITTMQQIHKINLKLTCKGTTPKHFNRERICKSFPAEQKNIKKITYKKKKKKRIESWYL